MSLTVGFMDVCVKVARLTHTSRPTLCDPLDCVVHVILQPKILEWVAFPFSRGSNPGLPHCREIPYQLSYQGTPHGCILTSKFVKVYTLHM